MNEVGEKLKEARKSKGYTLDDLQQMTKIQKRYLVAVEEGNLGVLPGNFYARAFIKQYADSVGLNGEELVSEHMDTLPQAHDSSYTENVQKTQTRSKSKNGGFMATLRDSLPSIFIVVLVIAIIFAIYLAVISTSNEGDSESFIQENTSSGTVEVEENQADQASGEEAAVFEAETGEETENEVNESEQAENIDDEIDETTAEQTISEIESTESITTYSVSGSYPATQELVLSAEGGESWISVDVDGQSVEQALVSEGESLETTFDNTVSTVTLVVGNSPVTRVELNGERVPYNVSESEAIRQEIYLVFE